YELNSLLLKKIYSTLHNLFVQLHVWNSVHQQTTYSIRLLKHRDQMARPVKLVCTRKSSRTRSNNRDSLARPRQRRLSNDPTFLESPIDNGALDTLNRNRIVIYSQHTRSFARRRTHSASELRKVVRLMKQFQRTTPIACVNQVIPIRNEIVQRTTG